MGLVAKAEKDDLYNHGDELNGWFTLSQQINPFGESLRIPSFMEISQRLSFMACASSLSKVSGLLCKFSAIYGVSNVSKQLQTLPNVEILQPPVTHYPPLQWDKLDEIVTKGYEYAKPIVDGWISNKV